MAACVVANCGSFVGSLNTVKLFSRPDKKVSVAVESSVDFAILCLRTRLLTLGPQFGLFNVLAGCGRAVSVNCSPLPAFHSCQCSSAQVTNFAS